MQSIVIHAITARNETVITSTTGRDIGEKVEMWIVAGIWKSHLAESIKNFKMCMSKSNSTPGKLPLGNGNKSVSEEG